MSDLCVAYTGFPGGLVLNSQTPGTNGLSFAQDGVCDGLAGAPVRDQVDPRGQTSGSIIHPKFLAARIITMSGIVRIQNPEGQDVNTAYLTAVNTVEEAWRTALEGALNTAFTLTWTPTGLTQHSISVTYGVPGGELKFSGPMALRQFTFQLISDPGGSGSRLASPAISVA